MYRGGEVAHLVSQRLHSKCHFLSSVGVQVAKHKTTVRFVYVNLCFDSNDKNKRITLFNFVKIAGCSTCRSLCFP